MKNILTLLILIVSFGFADSALLLKKGWQLIGSTTSIDDMGIFDKKDVEQIWHFDASTQKWMGYSPDAKIQTKIAQKGYKSITSLKSWHGFWVKSKRSWTLVLKDSDKNSDENITLKKGWNLISLPINSAVSPDIFGDSLIWKYASGGGWEFFQKGDKESFPTISHISNSDGIWVKSDKDMTIQVSTNSAKLHNFKTTDEVKEYIRDMLLTNSRPVCGYYQLKSVQISEPIFEDGQDIGANASQKSSSPSSGENASGTNLQEQGVDESDILKHDDRYIYYVSRDPKNFLTHFINVTTFENIANNTLDPIQTIVIGGYVDSIYLVDKRLIVLSNYGTENGKSYRPDGSVDKLYKDTPAIVVDIFDVSDISDIKKLSSYKITGHITSSRVVDDKLFLITSFYPYIQRTYPYRIYVDAPECKEYFKPREDSEVSESIVADDYKKYARCYGLQVDKDGRFYRVDYDRVKIGDERLLPLVQKDKEEQKNLISPKTFYAPSKKDQDPTITTISRFGIADANLEKTTTVLGHADTIYASRKALYIVSSRYPLYVDFANYKKRSAIYKFLLDDKLSYKSSGFINGNILNQFSLSEYRDILRVATTEGNSWQNDTKNSIFTLEDANDRLLIRGVLSGLGKEGEVIRSVRFMEDRGFVVTFKQSDPFYTIDLSDPTNPKRVGEVQVYGFSSYLHPIDKDHILGIGRDATPDGQIAGVKMELFDISDFANPILLDSYSFGNRVTFSGIEHNHKELSFRDSDKLFAFAYSTGSSWNNRVDQLGVFQVVNDKIETYKSILDPDRQRDYSNYKRGLIFDLGGKSYITYFSNGKIAYSLLDDLKEIR